jgi:hypothetical protein
MTKKHFIALADAIREHNETAATNLERFTAGQLMTFASAFCKINPAFKTERWLDYIAGKCGPNGRKL